MRWLTRAFGGDARAPRDVDAAMRGALLAALSRDWDETERLLVAACQLDSRSIEPYLALARLLRSRGEVGRAIRIHQNLLLRLPNGSKEGRAALVGLAADFQAGGFLRRAIAAYEDVLAGDARDTGALGALARLYAEARDFERAIEVERRLAKVEGRPSGPAEAKLRVLVAEAARAEGRGDDARKALKQALRRDKGCAEAWLLLGNLEAEREKPRAALAAWVQVAELEPEAAGAVYPRIEATYAALGRAREFEAFIGKRLASAPEDTVARIALARHLGARGEVKSALEELRRIVSRDPDDCDARIQIGRLLLAEGRNADAAREYAELLDALERRASASLRGGNR